MIKDTDAELDIFATSIKEEVKNNVAKIRDVLSINFDNLILKFANLQKNEKEKVISNIINNELLILKKELTLEQFRNIRRDIDEITDYYISRKKEYDSIVEEGESIADEMLFKVLGYNNRKI